MIWVITNLSVLILGVDTGLYVAILVELLSIFIILSRKTYFEIEQIQNKSKSKEIHLSIKGSLFIANSDDIYKKILKSKVLDKFVDVHIRDIEGYVLVLDLRHIGYVDHSGRDVLEKLKDQFLFDEVLTNWKKIDWVDVINVRR